MLRVRHQEDDCGLSRGRVRRSAEVTCWSNKSRSNTPKLEKRKDSDQSAEGLGHEDPTANQLLLLIGCFFFFCVINLEVFFCCFFFFVWIAFCWIRLYRLTKTLLRESNTTFYFASSFLIPYLYRKSLSQDVTGLPTPGSYDCYILGFGFWWSLASFVLLFLRWRKSSSCSPTDVWNYPQN